MTLGPRRLFQRRMGRDDRAWPMLALLLLVVLAAAGSVLWFMREAMRNERLAVGEKLAEAYRGHLTLAVGRVEARWMEALAQLDSTEPGAAHFARCVREGLADSVICFDANGAVAYPLVAGPGERPSRPQSFRAERSGAEEPLTSAGSGGAEQDRAPGFASPTPATGEALQSELRDLVRAGKTDAAVAFVIERFAEESNARVFDELGRLVAANAELLALDTIAAGLPQRARAADYGALAELSPGVGDARFAQLAARLHRRLADYEETVMPSAQRRFLMREMTRLVPGTAPLSTPWHQPWPGKGSPQLRVSGPRQFNTLPAEDLAARFLEAHPAPESSAHLRLTELRDLWSVATPGGRVLALLSTENLRTKLTGAADEFALPKGVSVAVIAPGRENHATTTINSMPLGAALPGWRLALLLDERALFHSIADRRAARLLVIGSVVVCSMLLLTLIVARGFGRQVRLARLKNDLVANVSHELKTPLTAMRALVDTLLDSEQMEEKTTREYLGLVARENARLSRLIDNFLTFSRLERNQLAFDFTRLDPRAVVDSAVAAFGERADVLEVSAPDIAGVEIEADADALTTAVLNLLDNAWKYSGDKKRIVLRLEARDGSVRFSVEDNGPGLTPRERRRVFGRFYQVDRRLSRTAGGCGLGLNIVESIVAAHSGAVEVASEPGRGSTFTITLPAAS